MTPFRIWMKAQVFALVLSLPALVFPPFYFLLGGLSLLFGLPAIVLFYLLLVPVKLFLHNSKPVTTWVAALACLPGMLLITGTCVILATAAVCHAIDGHFEWELAWLGLPGMIGTAAAVLTSRKDIHQFIYPELYAAIFKEHTSPDAGMVNA